MTLIQGPAVFVFYTEVSNTSLPGKRAGERDIWLLKHVLKEWSVQWKDICVMLNEKYEV